jgi:hypothetical protein
MLAKKIQKLRYHFEEEDDDDVVRGGEPPQRFKGYQDETYSSELGGNANYAIMIYDAKRNIFKMVPVEKHFKFEKEVKTFVKTPKPATLEAAFD